MRGVDLDAIEAGLLRALRGGGVGGDAFAAMRALVIASGMMVSNVVS